MYDLDPNAPPEHLDTVYLSAVRASPEALDAAVRGVASNPIIETLLGRQGGALAVVNEQRQVVAVNTRWLGLTPFTRAEDVLGLRPGEAVGCVNSHGPGGCGTSRACASCGAAVAMLMSLRSGEGAARECVLTTRDDAGDTIDRDLEVQSLPLVVGDRRYLMLTFTDRSTEKRRAALEHAFYHDLNNVITGLVCAAEALGDGELARDAADDVQVLVDRLKHEVRLQQALARSDTPTYPVTREPLRVRELLEALDQLFRRHPAAQGRTLEVVDLDPSLEVVTDRYLALRVLTNLALNAFEAVRRGGTVRVNATRVSGAVRFEVWNAGAIPAAVIPRIFQRYFSTKAGEARGQGTFAVKLLTEQYLGGHAGFATSSIEGTTFWVDLPT